MNAEEMKYYLFMECEELKEKKLKMELTEDEKVNLETNPYFVAERTTKGR